LNICHEVLDTAEATMTDGTIAAEQTIDLMMSLMSDGLDHPGLWTLAPSLVAQNPLIVPALEQRSLVEPSQRSRVQLQLLLALSTAAADEAGEVLQKLMPLCANESQNVQVQGALFHLEGMLDPTNPKYQLAGKFCITPFVELDVLENSTHLCCASLLPTSTGNLADTPWRQVWNGDAAQAIRASIHDGSYRHCNKRTCPKIQSNQLVDAEELGSDPGWRGIIQARATEMLRKPEKLNLSYDRTCNLSCPSCRTSRYAADDATRARLNMLQEREIMPLLENAKTVFVTGSGDPFASKTFRRLMAQLDAASYPDLKFIIMTNGMLFTQRQWSAFPSLHRRVELLSISLDAATAGTHELLRRGAIWPTMEKNLRFAGDLLADGLIDDFMITFTVQAENFREMGDAVDLAHQIGASQIHFARMTNWGTFSPAEYARKAVFIPGHPDHEAFVAACRDPRLQDPMIRPSDLEEFFHARG